MRNCGVVPFWKYSAEFDGHSFFEVSGQFATGLIGVANHMDCRAETGGGRCAAKQAHDCVQRVKQHSLTGSAHVREEAAISRVVLRAVARLVGHSNGKTRIVGQQLKVMFEKVMTGGIAASSIA